ncbi:MAG: hypothetical protein CFE44_28355, partial [Burkholderiales bacterium PBB4]
MSYLPFCTYLLKVSLGVSVFKHKTKRWRLPMIAITGATGQLGHYVIKSLMKTVPASQIVA